MLEFLKGFTPRDLGIVNYDAYRTHPVTHAEVQLEVIEFLCYSEARFRAACAPTGFGKQLIGLSASKLTGLRTAILTSTKGLQAQYRKEEPNGLIDIRGRSNYDCAQLWKAGSLDCKDGARLQCDYTQGNGCPYEVEKEVAKEAQLVSTNYSYWLSVNDKAHGIQRAGQAAKDFGENPFELLILDEADLAPKILADYLSMKFFESEISSYCEPKSMGENIQTWKRMVLDNIDDLKQEIKTAELEAQLRKTRETITTLHKLENRLDKFNRIVEIQDDWVLEEHIGTQWGRQWNFDVVWPGRYAERYLFCGIPNVILMSATLKPKTLALLGIGQDHYDYKEWDRLFPPQRHPIYTFPAIHMGKEVRMKREMEDGQLYAWVERIDEIIESRLDRKGIIQTVSYDRQQFLFDNSKFVACMLGNTKDPESESAAKVAENFKKAKAPSILVSPSFSTGWDFPDSECEYIIICKVPFKPPAGKVYKARIARDPQYSNYETMMELVQSVGRGMRSEKDRCEVFIVDAQIGWFVANNKTLAPIWFQDAVRNRKIYTLPERPEKL